MPCSAPQEDRMKIDRNTLFVSPSQPAVSRTPLFDGLRSCLDKSFLLCDKPVNLNAKRNGMNSLPKARGSPLADSDTSGFSSDTSALSDSYLIDLMVRTGVHLAVHLAVVTRY